MKKFSDKTERIVKLRLEWHEIENMIYKTLKAEGYNFENKEIDLNFKFIEEGSPSYRTDKLECNITITKDLSNA